MNISDAFGHDFATARSLFLQAADEAGAKLTRFECPQRGPEGEALSSDFAWIGPADAGRVLLSISGSHGVEGIAGSGVQVNALRSGAYAKLPSDCAVALLHAITPHGFAWLRRCNEDGVDICRNFVDFSQPLPESAFYREFARDIIPEEWVGPVREEADARLYGWVGEHGVTRFVAELARGQYQHADAPFYGGRAPTWSNATLREILRSRLGRARDVMVIDYHTGLGETGTGQLLGLDHPCESPYARGAAAWGEKYVPINDEASVAYEVIGDIECAFAEELPAIRVVAAAYEFGTVEAPSVLQALRGDHWLHRHGDLASPLAARIKDEIRSAFYCEDPAWQRAVFEQAALAEREAISMLASG